MTVKPKQSQVAPQVITVGEASRAKNKNKKDESVIKYNGEGKKMVWERRRGKWHEYWGEGTKEKTNIWVLEWDPLSRDCRDPCQLQ